jgi:cytoskeletal protein CcmA (bactofilin family)
MDDKNKPDGSAKDSSEGESLENTGTPDENIATPPDEGGVVAEPGKGGSGGKGKGEKKLSAKNIKSRINIYLLIFVLVIIGVIMAVVIIYLKTSSQTNNNNPSKIPSQNLSASALQQLANNGTTIGDAKHTLNIQSNTVFQGTVLVRGNLQVAGTVQIGNTLALVGLTVSGQSSFGNLQAKSLSVDGNTAVKGQLTASSLSVSGGGSFNGAVTAPILVANSLQLNGDLGITHHIDTGGGVPGSARGGALGGGGTASVSGSDTAGTISIHTGGGPSAGCFITVYFTNSFGSTPHVVITPVGGAAAGLHYYITRSTSNFSVCSGNAPSASTSFDFDYIVLD